MSNFKPQITVITEESRRDYCNGYGKGNPYKTIQYKTYAELKRNIKQHLVDNLEAQVPVCRSRKGEWGEYFENWKLVDGKPTIIKEGWM